MAAVILLATLAIGSPASRQVGESCLHYEPAVVTLEGTLGRSAPAGRAGPARRGTTTDSAFVLVLVRSICVAPDSASADADRRPESGIRTLQLAVGTDAVWAKLKALVGRHLQVTGELFHASASRRPPVLLWVIQIDASGPPPDAAPETMAR